MDEDNRFLEVTYQNGDKEVMYFKDFSSGAMIENTTCAGPRSWPSSAPSPGEGRGIRTQDLLESIKQEYKEHGGSTRPNQPG